MVDENRMEERDYFLATFCIAFKSLVVFSELLVINFYVT